MKRITGILIFIFHLLVVQANPQESAAAPPRTPEQEAAMQTRKMRQELNLSSDQEREIYEINLRHARERQTSTSRSEALKRVRTKEIEFQRVLTRGQYDRLQEKRMDYSPQGVETSGFIQRRTQPVTNPQRIENGRVVSGSEIRRSVSDDSGRRAIPSNEVRRSEPTESRPSMTPRSSGRSETVSPVRSEPRSSGRSESASPGRSEPRSSGNSGSRSSSSGGRR